MTIKQQLIAACLRINDNRLLGYTREIDHLKDAIEHMDPIRSEDEDNGHTKLMEDLETLMAKHKEALKAKEILNSMAPIGNSASIVMGSVVKTTVANYFISLSFGKIELVDEVYFAISLASPIGQLLKYKTKGDCFDFNGSTVKILETL